MKPMSEALRLFVGIRPAEDIILAAVELQSGLKAAIARFSEPPVMRWVPPGNFHLTLRFLGQVKTSRLDDLKEACRRAATGHNPFELIHCGLGVFPSTRKPRLLWSGLSNTGELHALERSLTGELSRVGFGPEEREFRPHLTLARLKAPGRGDWDGLLRKEASLGTSPLDRIILYESRLATSGATYHELASFRVIS